MDQSPFLFAAVVGEVEGEDSFVIRGTLKRSRMAQRANGAVIAGAPVLLHAGAREVVVLRVAVSPAVSKSCRGGRSAAPGRRRSFE